MNEVPEVGRQHGPDSGQVLAVGIDLASIAEVRSAAEEFGEGYLRRVFTPAELSHCLGSGNPMAELAATWAAKEAAIKALAMAESEAPWHFIEVWWSPNAPCQVRLSGPAAVVAEELGFTRLAVSLSYEGDMATAIVIATGRN